MSISSWLSGTFSHSQSRRAQRRNPATTSSHRRPSVRPSLETLETRLTLSLTTLASFAGTNGSFPRAAVIMDSSGNLYGTTNAGGASNGGTVFELAHGSGAITTLASFNGTNGWNPYDALIMDSSGNLYGTTGGGGAFGWGTVFELARGSGAITTLASFNGTDGASPFAALIMDNSGNLYGTTVGGIVKGTPNYGTVFELAHGSGTITTLVSFNVTNGAEPEDALIMDSRGDLYGTTRLGGRGGSGTVFELAHSHTVSTLAWNVEYPTAGLIMDSSGNLYGTAPFGGAHGSGTVFELAHGSRTITTLASFNGGNSPTPNGALIMDSSGNLYGTTGYGGGSRDGSVFELAYGSGTITELASFNGGNGATPYGGLIMDSSGNLYGTTTYGGSAGLGTVFELPGSAGHSSFQISGLPSSTDAGASHMFTVADPNTAGTTITGYTGTIDFTSADSTPNVPTSDTFMASDKGTQTLIWFVLQKKGKPSITATDALFSSVTGSLGVEVS